jgi:hypothetical protein
MGISLGMSLTTTRSPISDPRNMAETSEEQARIRAIELFVTADAGSDQRKSSDRYNKIGSPSHTSTSTFVRAKPSAAPR